MKACVTWNSRVVTIQTIRDILMKTVIDIFVNCNWVNTRWQLQMVSIFTEMVVAYLKVLCQNSPEKAEEDDENYVRITDNAVDIRSQYLPTEIQAPYRLR